MKLFRGFAVASAALAFALTVLGSWVRINNAGLTCPDWPLCNGAIVPSLHGAVVLEWSHRVVVVLESFVVLGTILTGYRVRKALARVTPALVALALIFVSQVSLGGATVILGNSPPSVMLHWGMAMALLATSSVLAVLSLRAPQTLGARAAAPGADASAFALAVAATVAFVTMCVGAYVSSSSAGLACTTFPACDGTLFGTSAQQFAHMLHRLAAFVFALIAAFATYVTYNANARGARAFATLGMSLVAVQILLGIANVLWSLPVVLREAHAANAGATFLAFVIATVFATLEPGAAPVPHEGRARTRRPMPSRA